MNESHAKKLKSAKDFLKTITPRNQPIIGIHCEYWPRNERCYRTLREAIQAMRVSR